MSFRRATQAVLDDAWDGYYCHLHGITRTELLATRAKEAAFWDSHPGAREACMALDDFMQASRAACVLVRARKPGGVRRLVLLQMESEDCEDHAPGDDEWVWTALSGEQLLELASVAYPYRYRDYSERLLFSEWLHREGLAEPMTDDLHNHVVY